MSDRSEHQPRPADTLRILVVDDEEVSRRALEQCLADTEHEVVSVAGAAEGLRLLEDEPFDVAFVDLRLDDASGMDVIPKALALAPWLKVVLVTAYASIESAVEAVRAGATDYLEKPLRPGEVRVLVEKLLAIRRKERASDALREDAERSTGPALLDSDDPDMRRILELARQTAPSTATILLMGESGTGKGVLARAIHRWSDRSDGPFSVVSCPSLSEDLLRSELFGHVRGAFTGAVKAQRGRIETTQGGTLFLDEVADLPPSIQPQLLRFVQDREYERVGDTRTRRADVRIITATNQDLRKAVREGRFREDLFYRLDVMEIVVPPLRERTADILPLARTFLHRYARKNNRDLEGFTEAAERLLETHPWPGNVRELENAVERAVILTRGRTVPAEVLPTGVPGSPTLRANTGDGPLLSLEEMERAHIARVLELSPSVKDAATALGVSTATLWRRRKKYEL